MFEFYGSKQWVSPHCFHAPDELMENLGFEIVNFNP